jgi:NADH-quinone oxidoreductase subunit F
MDIRIHEPRADEAERAAVDSVLGPPQELWGHEARSKRDLLLPALHAVQDRFGWLAPGALNYISERLTVPPAELFGVATFYHLFSMTPQPSRVVHVCDDIACRIRGAEKLCAEMESTGVAWKRSPCLGQCERAPAALVIEAGQSPKSFAVAPVRSIDDIAVEAVGEAQARQRAASKGEAQARQRAASKGEAQARQRAASKNDRPPERLGLDKPPLQLLRRVGRIDPTSVQAYRADGGYNALSRAFELRPEGVIQEVLASNLVGRGGAAFPTGRKWDAVSKAPARPHYVVCNADESEPGTFKDRILMESDPFAIIEGMTIAAYAISSERGFFYIRGEYPLATERVDSAIRAAREAGLLGKNILGSDFSFDVEVRRGAGAYICGEETALFNSIEGKRGEPRNKPPFPVHVGLFGKPTVINNVETLVNIPLILAQGGKAFADTGTPGSTGPKLFCVSGHVVRPGLYEVPFGRTLRELIDMAGGVPGNKRIQTILLGGAAGTFIGPERLDVPLTFEGTRAIGAALGSGVVMVFDETVDIADILARIAEFFRDESCGQCVPCRVGTIRQDELLARLRSGRLIGSKADEFVLLKEIGQAMRDASICGLGQTASSAIESAFANLKLRLKPR